jgi:hypothetical protein
MSHWGLALPSRSELKVGCSTFIDDIDGGHDNDNRDDEFDNENNGTRSSALYRTEKTYKCGANSFLRASYPTMNKPFRTTSRLPSSKETSTSGEILPSGQDTIGCGP